MQSFHIFFPYLNIQDPTKLPDTKKQENETLFFFFSREKVKKKMTLKVTWTLKLGDKDFKPAIITMLCGTKKNMLMINTKMQNFEVENIFKRTKWKFED